MIADGTEDWRMFELDKVHDDDWKHDDDWDHDDDWKNDDDHKGGLKDLSNEEYDVLMYIAHAYANLHH